MSNKAKLGAYIAPQHDQEKWKKYLFEIDPGFVRILMPGDSPVQTVSDVWQVCKGAQISLRWWDLDDGGEPNKRAKIERGAVQAKGDVQEAVRRIEMMEAEAARRGMPFPPRGYVWLNSLNEKPTWEVGLRPKIVDYEIAFIKEAEKFGFGAMAGEFNVGHPSEWPPDWEWYSPVVAELKRNGGILAIHEYWQPEGPKHVWRDEAGNERVDWGALAGRYEKIPFDVRIVVTECGVDGRIFNRHAVPDTGYLKFMDAAKYGEQMRTYLQEVGRWPKIEWVLPFITDYHDKEWASFDTLVAKDAFVRVIKEVESEQQVGGVFTNHLPSVSSGGQPSNGNGKSHADVVLPIAYGVVDPFVAKAILEVESGGVGFNIDGTLKVRFEAHIFERYVPKIHFDSYFRYDPNDILSAYYRHNVNGAWFPIHRSQIDEYQALALAVVINEKAALLSTSMGAAQIMGFNHLRVGFATPKKMYDAFRKDAIYHLIAFFNYCFSDKKMMEAVLAKDWRAIAALYNGTKFVDTYSERLSRAYNRLVKENNE